MLKKANRLTTKFEFNITRKYGHKYAGDTFFAYVLKPNNYIGNTKIGTVISKKLEKTAVKRNKLKRVYMELCRINLEKLPKNCWIVIHPTKKGLEANHEKISLDFNKVLSKIFIS